MTKLSVEANDKILLHGKGNEDAIAYCFSNANINIFLYSDVELVELCRHKHLRVAVLQLTNHLKNVRFDVFTAVKMTICFLWVVSPLDS
jgi:hypothetical protein